MELLEQIQFLKELQVIMQHENEHDYDSQAAPRFWTVGDYSLDACWEEHAETYHLHSPNDADDYTLEEFKENILESDDYTKKAKRRLEGITDSDDWLEWVQEHYDEDAYLVPVRKNHIIRPNTMFLTKEEAKQHIKNNHYHYTSEAHTYAMTAWRAPKVEKLLNILMTMDFEQLENMLKGKG